MKKLKYFINLLMLVSIALTAQAQQPKIAVLVYGNKTGSEFIQNELITAFTDDGNYIVLERQEEFMNLIAKEHSFQQSGWVKDEDIIGMAKKCGAEYVCCFKMLDLLFGEQPIAARILSVESGRVMSSVQWSGKFNSMDDVRKACNEICRKMTRSSDL